MKHQIRSVRHGLKDRLLQSSGIWLLPPGTAEAVSASGHKFHHPKVFSFFDPPCKSVWKRIYRCIAKPRIVVEGIRIQCFGALVIINAVGSQSCGIGRHKLCSILLQHLCLNVLILNLAVAGKPFKLQPYRRIFIKCFDLLDRTDFNRIHRNLDLSEMSVFLRPENTAASLVKFLDRMIIFFQILLKFFLADRTMTASGSFLCRFIVNLKSCHIWIASIMFSNGFCNLCRIFPIRFVIVAIMPSSAKRSADSSVIHI